MATPKQAQLHVSARGHHSSPDTFIRASRFLPRNKPQPPFSLADFKFLAAFPMPLSLLSRVQGLMSRLMHIPAAFPALLLASLSSVASNALVSSYTGAMFAHSPPSYVVRGSPHYTDCDGVISSLHIESPHVHVHPWWKSEFHCFVGYRSTPLFIRVRGRSVSTSSSQNPDREGSMLAEACRSLCRSVEALSLEGSVCMYAGPID